MKINNKRIKTSVNQLAKHAIQDALKTLGLTPGKLVPDGVYMNDKEMDEYKRHFAKHVAAIVKRFYDEEVESEVGSVSIEAGCGDCTCNEDVNGNGYPVEDETVCPDPEDDGLGHMDVSDD